jgi:predicted nucleic acid-binding protein
MITAVDTSVLFILLNQEEGWEQWETCLSNASSEGSLSICPVTFAEYSVNFSSGAKTQKALDSMSIQWSPFTQASSFLAGKIQLSYRKNKGPRKQMIPDFLVAAHASLQADRLASTDRGFLRSYFPDLDLLAP